MEKSVPTTHATWHFVSVVLVHTFWTPAAHEESAAHGVHGATPDSEKVVPAEHGSLHTVSADVVHAVFTP